MPLRPFREYVHSLWHREGGYREVLVLAIPLIISTGAHSIQHIVDRIFLTWYSPAAIAASFPAAMVNFSIMSLFFGTAGYVSTFVAQYYGAGRYERIGPSLWQGIYVAVIGGLIHLMLIPSAGYLFGFVGHETNVMNLEIRYFRILCLGAAPSIASSALSGFFSGRGETKPVMWVCISATCVNIVLDYALIFGNFGFPRLGITGAAIATVISLFFSFLVYLIMILRRFYRFRYNTIGGWRFDKVLFLRLMRFGLPNGAQFFLDVAGFTVFILFVGRLGTVYLAATNIALNISSLAFMPMIGVGMAVSILVGQKLGKNRPDVAERSVYTGFFISFFYIAIIATLYVFTPELFLAPYAAQANGQNFTLIREIAMVLLRFVAFYSLFDALNIIFAAGIKGAGDTRFVMLIIILASSLVLVIPSYIALFVLHAHIYAGWVIFSVYMAVLGLSFMARFLGGKWKSMRVIEKAKPSLPSTLPETPFIEL